MVVLVGLIVNECNFRYKETFFRSKEAVKTAKAKLVSLVLADMDAGEEPIVQDASLSSGSSTISEEDCSTSIIDQISKKIRLEKRQEVVLCYVSSDVQWIHPGYWDSLPGSDCGVCSHRVPGLARREAGVFTVSVKISTNIDLGLWVLSKQI